LAGCALAAIAIGTPAVCMASVYDDTNLDDSAPSLRLVDMGNTPFPRLMTARGASGDDVPTPSIGIALCMPDLYCTLESEPRY
jgi:hypothetical protein